MVINSNKGENKKSKTKQNNAFSSFFSDLTKGIFKLNPIFVSALGLCPTLAVTTSLDNSIGMGLATTFVLIFSAIFISAIRKIIPKDVRIPVFIVIIATFVTIVQLVMKAYFPVLDRALGIFVPLIVVNCIILGRAESFSSRYGIFRSILDALGTGVGFSIALMLIGSIREIFGTSSISFFGNTLIASTYITPAMIFSLAPGALFTMGILLAFINFIAKIDFRRQASHSESHNPDNLVNANDSSNASKNNKEVDA